MSREFKKMMFAGLFLIACAGFSMAGEKDNTSKFYYDSRGAKTLADQQAVFVSDANDLNLKPRIKYFFEYDENDRVIEKKAMRWDVFKRDWVNAYRLQFTYSDQAVVIELTQWNKQKETYDFCTERAVYNLNADKLAAYNYYRRNSSGGHWVLEHSFLVEETTPIFGDEKGILVADLQK